MLQAIVQDMQGVHAYLICICPSKPRWSYEILNSIWRQAGANHKFVPCKNLADQTFNMLPCACQRTHSCRRAARKVQHLWRARMYRKHDAALCIQKNYRMSRDQGYFLLMKQAALIIQVQCSLPNCQAFSLSSSAASSLL